MVGSTGPNMPSGISLSALPSSAFSGVLSLPVGQDNPGSSLDLLESCDSSPLPIAHYNVRVRRGQPLWWDSCSRILYLPRVLAFLGFLTIKTGLLITKILCSW